MMEMILTKKRVALFLLLLISCLCRKNVVYANESDSVDTELLVMIDNSGSMVEAKKTIDEQIGILKKLIKEWGLDVNITYLLFNEEIRFEKKYENVSMEKGKETCFLQGMEEANKWISEKIGDKKSVRILLISDLFSSRKIIDGQITKYNYDAIDSEQKKIRDIENQWDKIENLEIVIWSWDSMCKGENPQNDKYRLKDNEEECKKGYQVRLNENKKMKVAINEKESQVKIVVETFERLFNASGKKWKELKKRFTLSDESRGCYIYVLDTDKDIVIENSKKIEEGLYLVEKESEGFNIECEDAFVFEIEDVRWNIYFPENILKTGKSFKIYIQPEGMIKNIEKYEVNIKAGEKKIELTYSPDEKIFVGEFVLEQKGRIIFECYINGKKVPGEKRKYIN